MLGQVLSSCTTKPYKGYLEGQLLQINLEKQNSTNHVGIGLQDNKTISANFHQQIWIEIDFLFLGSSNHLEEYEECAL
jgi:hypothetical protein